ncbi:hypothetical protein COU60_00755 [Candidatus Pacearchaeota archaeon CG10_big_fil_rev_8_21_14_0_10_34_76]|nr:MAG: hypothetical protein COU60_00755 [Candidatus Pacearchaeota archaeon CG10_big_fil_rev_8_21_14_0_10_34_76]
MEQQRNLWDWTDNFSWSKYNESQMKEKTIFMQLLREICNLIEQPPHSKGRKPVNYSDMIYALALKNYLTFSSRRVHSDLKLAKELDLIHKEFHFNTLLKYLEEPSLKLILKELIEISALPLKQIELDFAVDATGFGTSKFVRWFDVKHGDKNAKRREFRKCHAMCGVKTNIITSVEVTEGYTHDSTQFEGVVKRTFSNWNVQEVSADKGYSSRKNLNLISELGAVPYIPFKKSTSGKRVRNHTLGIWGTMYRYFNEHKDEFLQHYHKRSNVESVFSMIKARFGNNVRCKKQISQDNEILLKCLCHNLCCLVQEIFLNKIDINFKKCADNYIAHKH